MAPLDFAPVQNNQNRYNQNKGQGNNFNRGNNFQGSFFQNQPSTLGTLPSNTIPNPKGKMKAATTLSGLTYEGHSIPTNFSSEKASTSGTLPSNTMPNPKGEMKVVTTRSGLAYEGPSIPTNSPLEKVIERDTEKTTDKEHSNCQGSTTHIQPLVVPILIPKLDVPTTQPKPNIPYPSRLNDQKIREKAMNQMEKFFQIFHDLHFDISFADALL
nr:reverse transcriptase domain-containing protein [Tanacetum cinerariifolium]